MSIACEQHQFSSAAPAVLVVMGVCGVGKTTIAVALANAIGAEFVDADTLHPPENVAKMASGISLEDADRWGWLEAVAARLRAWTESRKGGVVACSALKQRYRAILREGSPGVRVVYLKADREAIEKRLSARVGHYMPPSLLASQLAALEEPCTGTGEGSPQGFYTADAEADVPAVVSGILAWLSAPECTS